MGSDTCCFVLLKVVHTCAFVHMLRDLDTCYLFKCLRSSIHVRLYTCLGTLTLVVCSSVKGHPYMRVCTHA
jgi:hypothetical protein